MTKEINGMKILKNQLESIKKEASSLLFYPTNYFNIVCYMKKEKIKKNLFLFVKNRNINLFRNKKDLREYNDKIKRKTFECISETIDNILPTVITEQLSSFQSIKDIKF